MNSTMLVTLNAVRKNVYEQEIFRHIDYSFASKGLTWIKGAEGQGKTLLTNLLCNLEAPDSGSIDWQESGGRNMGVVFDTPALISNLSIAQNLALALDHYQVPMNGKDKAEYISELLDAWRLIKTENLRPVALSRGQSCRVALIRALIANPKVLIWDDAFECFAEDDLHFVHYRLQEIHSQGMAFIFLSRRPSLGWDFPFTQITLKEGRLEV
ncbi:MAG: ATP-binding cassette domain-containing protein [Bdellovibrio sp.]|nr:ATP-binding cassette domain-containing protein [Bdellovibrio sp.]